MPTAYSFSVNLCMKVTETTNRDEGSEYTVMCAQCQNETRHHVILSQTRDFDDDGWLSQEKYQIVKCRGCDSVRFRYEKSDEDSEQTDYESGQTIFHGQVEIYPLSLPRRKVKYSEFLPYQLKPIYDEVLLALAADTPLLAAMGMRLLIETICRDFGATDWKLEKKIDSLITNGKVSEEEAKTLHSLREAGNASAHQAVAHTRNQLLRALTVIEHILTSLYLLPHHRQDLPPNGNS